MIYVTLSLLSALSALTHVYKFLLSWAFASLQPRLSSCRPFGPRCRYSLGRARGLFQGAEGSPPRSLEKLLPRFQRSLTLINFCCPGPSLRSSPGLVLAGPSGF